MNKQHYIEQLLQQAYNDSVSDNCDLDFITGCLGEALALLRNDYSSFDNLEEITNA